MPDSPPNNVYSMIARHLVTIIVVTFGFGGWIMNIRKELLAMQRDVEDLKLEQREMMEWRHGTTLNPEGGVTNKLARIEGKISDLYRRTEQKP